MAFVNFSRNINSYFLKSFSRFNFCLPKNNTRSFSISSSSFLKEIRRTETEKQIVIEGVTIKSERAGKVVNLHNRGGCPLCRVNLKSLKHTTLDDDAVTSFKYISTACVKEIKQSNSVGLLIMESIQPSIIFTKVDILIISQFINSDGTLIPQHITGLCNKQHFRVKRAVALAQRAGLIPKPPGTPLLGDYQKYNTYFKKY